MLDNSIEVVVAFLEVLREKTAKSIKIVLLLLPTA